MITLPLLRKADAFKFWPNLRDFLPNDASAELRTEFVLISYNYERTWIKKLGTSNLFSFNQLRYVKTTNAAEAYHSSLKKFVHFYTYILLKNIDLK